jgi:hypothetical protein
MFATVEGTDGGPRSPSLIPILEGAAKASGVLAVCGYVSARAHFNRLGLTLYGVTSDRYLMETWHFVVVMAERYLPIVAPALLFAFAVRSWLARPQRRARAKEVPRVGRSWPTLVEPLGVLLAAVVTYFAYRRSIVSVSTDVAVGALDAAKIAGARSPPASVAILCFGCAIGFAYMSRWKAAAKEQPIRPVVVDRTRRAARWTWWALALHIPMAFGMTMHSASYPLARVTFNDQPLCGLLVAESNDSVTLWSAEAGLGETHVLHPAKEHHLEIFGLKDLLAEAASAAGGGHAPSCE